MNFNELNRLITPNLMHNRVPMLIGEPGIGKSSWVEDYVKTVLNTKCFVLSVNQLADKADLTGCRLVPIYEQVLDNAGNPVKNPDGTVQTAIVDYEQKFFPHTVIRQAIAYAKEHPSETPVLFMDEINRTTPDVTSEALSIPTNRSIGDRPLPDNLRVIVAGNDKGNVVALDTASVSRFINYRVEPDVATFLKVNPGLNQYIVNVLKKNNNLIFCESVDLDTDAGTDPDKDDASADFNMDEGVRPFTTPRTITYLSEWLNAYNYNDLMMMMNTPVGTSNLLNEAVIAHTGTTPFTMALMQEIVATGMVAQTNQTTIVKPASYETCKQCQSIDQLNAVIQSISDMEKSQLLVFALYDKSDNSNLIRALAPTINVLQPQDTQNLMMLNQNHQIDNGNLDVLNQTGTPIAAILTAIGL